MRMFASGGRIRGKAAVSAPRPGFTLSPDQLAQPGIIRAHVSPENAAVGPITRIASTGRRQRPPSAAADACIVPVPGWGRPELNRRVNHSAQRSDLRHRDFFSLPSVEDRAELFVDSVPGGRNDTKADVKKADKYGNFLFGAEAAARGMTLDEARRWAQGAQVVQDLLKRRWPSGKDNPDDPEMIANGYRYYMEGCSRQ